MRTLSLGSMMVRRLADAAALESIATRMADDLLTLGRGVPQEDWLIVGGSIARGEPTFIRRDGKRLLISDVDLLYIHDGEHPAMPPQQLLRVAERVFPSVDLITLPVADYRVIQTSLGYDYKNLGIAITEHGMPEHEPVQSDARDAYEILLYYLQAYFWDRLHDQWLAGADSVGFHLAISRLCLKVLRASAMLDGAYAHHDFEAMAPHVAARMRAELRWRTDPGQPPMNPGRFWSYVADAFTRFDEQHGHQRPDAVSFSPYATTSSGQIVARHHRAVHDLARAMSTVWLADPTPQALDTVKHRAWQGFTGWTGTRAQPTPEDYFARNKREINDHLLAMKVQVA